MIYTPHLACCRKDESLNNVTLADVYFGRAEKIRRKREKIKLKNHRTEKRRISETENEFAEQKTNINVTKLMLRSHITICPLVVQLSLTTYRAACSPFSESSIAMHSSFLKPLRSKAKR